MNKKVLLITLTGYFNFGNRLQNYALTKVIEKMGYHVDNLIVNDYGSVLKTKYKVFAKCILFNLRINKHLDNYGILKRELKFVSFMEKYTPNVVKTTAENAFLSDWSQYDFAVTGSDQVWHNWKEFENELPFYYLEFIEEAKRISSAPSFGFTQFPAPDMEIHKKGLLEMHALSCREREGCEMIKELTGRDAAQVLDPTLLLTREEWESIEKKPPFIIEKKYLLVFFLGEIPEDYWREINIIKNERNLQLININDAKDPEHYAISPNEFIWLIHHADTVCTDSFHACVFSILYTINLRVFWRQEDGFRDMFGRIRDLLEPLGMTGNVYGSIAGKKLSTVLNDNAEQYLEKNREKSFAYIKESLKDN